MVDLVRRATCVVLVPLLLLTSCGPLPREVKRELQPPANGAQVNRESPYLLAHMRDGRAISLDTWMFDDVARTVTGYGRVLDANRVVVSEGEQTIAIDDVALFETNVPHLPAGAAVARGLTVVVGTALVVTLAALLIVAIACLSDPKCFGSCPTFYAWDGTSPKLLAEGFSSSIAPRLEATDVDAIGRAVPNGRILDVTMKNEAPETHVVRHAHVLAAPRPDGGRAFASTAGGFRAATRLQPPSRATAPEGDVAAVLADFDHLERTSAADSTDLATRETIDLVFDEPPAGDLGLVLASRQSLLTSYLFYEALDALGPDAVRWMASLERGGSGALAQASAIGDAIGGVEVQLPDGAGGWRTVADVRETGPLATDARVVPLPVDAAAPGRPLAVRLRMARGAWRVNQAALAALGDPVEPVRLAPETVWKENHADDDARDRLADMTRTLVTTAGDTYTIRYRLPEHPERYELFLETRGYYLEWIREQWLASADPGRAMLLGMRPREALRVLAPEYVRAEAAFERSFWGNRHAGP